MNWLSAPYPTIESVRLKLAISFAMGLVCAIFLLVFKPFGLNTVTDRPGFFFGFGLMGTLSLLCAYFIYPMIWPKYFDPDQWRIKHELLFFTGVILQISIMIFTYNSTVGRSFSPQHSYPAFFLMTIAVGVLPILMMTYITEMVARERNAVVAKELNRTERETKEAIYVRSILNIFSEDKNPIDFHIDSGDFLFAQAQNNYAMLYWLDQGRIEQMLLRLNLKNLMNQIGHEENILRVHKSYVVNKLNILEVTGNARSLQLTLKACDTPIPVSRSFDKSMLA